MLGIIRIACIRKRPSRCAVLVLPFSCTKHHWKKPRTFGTMKLEAMFHCVQKCNLIFSPVETYLNPQRSSRRPPSWIFIRNILFILPLGAEWMEWRSVNSGIGMRNRKTGAFYILAILIPELWIKKRALTLFHAKLVRIHTLLILQAILLSVKFGLTIIVEYWWPPIYTMIKDITGYLENVLVFLPGSKSLLAGQPDNNIPVLFLPRGD